MANTKWQGVNINTGETELPKYNAFGVTEEIYIATLTTAIVTTDTILGPVMEAGNFIVSAKVATDSLDSASSSLFSFEVGYINNGTFTAAGLIASGNSVIAGTGGIVSMNVATAYGASFTNDITMAASVVATAGTAVAGKFRMGLSFTASP